MKEEAKPITQNEVELYKHLTKEDVLNIIAETKLSGYTVNNLLVGRVKVTRVNSAVLNNANIKLFDRLNNNLEQTKQIIKVLKGKQIIKDYLKTKK